MGIDRFTTFQITFDRIRKNIQRIETAYLRTFGLRSVHTACLLSLGSTERGLTVTELSKACATDKALTSRSTAELLERGYIALSCDKDDKKNNKRFILTDSGKELLDGMKEVIDGYIKRANTNIDESDLETFYKVLYSFDTNIEMIVADIPMRLK